MTDGKPKLETIVLATNTALLALTVAGISLARRARRCCGPSSISGIAAGLAHETNSPVGSLHASADVVARAVKLLRARLLSPELA